jgi:hypothetical protein
VGVICGGPAQHSSRPSILVVGAATQLAVRFRQGNGKYARKKAKIMRHRQNYLWESNPRLHSYLSKGNHVVLTDFACMESYKGNSLISLRRSLEIVSHYPSQVIVLKNTQAVIPLTYKPLNRIRTTIIDAEQTGGFSEFCRMTYALKLSALETEDYLAQRASRASREKFRKALCKVPNRKPHAQD